MGGVDISDQYISSYNFIRKSKKWWRKMFFWLLEVAVVNSFILYNFSAATKSTGSCLSNPWLAMFVTQRGGREEGNPHLMKRKD
jgi:hypothetical protein